jgi:hypothetical protein
MAARDFLTWFTVTVGVVSMIAAKANDDDDDEFEVDLDPLSSKFGKIRIGDVYVDPWGGFIQHIVLQARLYSEALVRGGERKQLGDYNTPTRAGLLAEFAQNKFHPSLSLIVAALSTHEEDGKRVNPYGEEFIVSEQIKERVTPMLFPTLNEIYKEEPNLLGGFLGAYAFLGTSINVYKEKKKALAYENPETSVMMKEFKPKGISDIKKDTYAVPLTDDELVQLNVNYRKKAATMLDLYSATKPSLDDKKMFPAGFEKVTDNQLEDARAQAIKKGVPEGKLDEESKKIAVEKKKRDKMSDQIGELTKLAQNAAAYEYFKALGKRIPPTIEEAVKEYEKKFKELQKQAGK